MKTLCRAVALLFLTGAAAMPAAAQAGPLGGMLDPNLATEQELRAVPHVSADLAKALVAGRPWLSPVALDSLLGRTLSPAQRQEVFRKLWVQVNLNSASKAEILLIPGVGNRMLHEFEEYRPYDGLPRFRREIAKYVDQAELDRLTAYVFVPIELNTATDADILSIPGVGRRMLHEFKEYRPYRGIEQFRREIGKYVDAKELARLERYVTLRQP